MSTHTAPAKLNLSLRILGKRDDGFHELDSLMVKLPGLADTITIEDAKSFSFTCSDASLPTDDSNLVVRTARAFAETSGLELHCAITLDKVIPHGAGLGGGSSDAATTLQALNERYDQPLADHQIHTIAASLGSDIPFFLTPGAARVTGRGEHIAPAPPQPELPVLLLKPSFGVATPDAYRRWQGATPLPGVLYDPQDIDGLQLVNDLELSVFGKHRFLGELKSWLLERPDCRAALLCGSGSTVFAVLTPDADPAALTAAAHRELDPSLWHWAGTTGA